MHLHFLMTNNNKLEFEKYKLGYGQKLKSNNEDKISQFSPSNFYFTVRKLVRTILQYYIKGGNLKGIFSISKFWIAYGKRGTFENFNQ